MKHVMNLISRKLILLGITIFAFSVSIFPSYGKPDVNNYSSNVLIGGAYVVFAGKTGGEIRKSELTVQTEVRVDGCAKGYKIMTYTLEITRGQSKSTYQANSNQLTKEMKAKL